MHSIAFHVGSLKVHWYGILVAAGFLSGTLVLMWRCKHASMKPDDVLDLSFVAMVAGVIGARLFYVVQFWDREFRNDFWQVFRIDKGGVVFYGGFMMALIALCICCRWKRLKIPYVLDIFSVAIALGHAFGRIGCFMEGCCFGSPTSCSLGVVFPKDSHAGLFYSHGDHFACSPPLHPTQLYECAGNLLIFATLSILLGRFKRGGQIAALYLVLYGVMRFTVEMFRGDHVHHIAATLTPSQSIALFLMIPLGIALFIIFGRLKDGESAKQ